MIPETESATSEQQFETLFRTHYARIARVIGRVIHDQARAEELAAEVFLKWKRHPGAHGSRAEGWLYRTAVREALDEWRRRRRRSRLEKVFALFRMSEEPPPPTPEQLHTAEITQQQVRAVLALLRGTFAEALLLWSEDLSYRQIAEALNIQPNYVGSLLSRAQAAFRKEYIARYGDN